MPTHIMAIEETFLCVKQDLKKNRFAKEVIRKLRVLKMLIQASNSFSKQTKTNGAKQVARVEIQKLLNPGPQVNTYIIASHLLKVGKVTKNWKRENVRKL